MIREEIKENEMGGVSDVKGDDKMFKPSNVIYARHKYLLLQEA